MFVFAFALSILSAPVLPAQDVPAQEPATTTAKPERKICKRTQDTGSRMGSARVCKTAAEWRGEDVTQGNIYKSGDPGQR